MATACISTDPIRAESLLAGFHGDGDGAVLLFVGVVRDHADGRPVRGMRYEAYEPMAREVLLAIATEAEDLHAVTAVEVVHRTGELVVGEASVAIAVAGPHREAAYRASRYVIEEIKKRLPVWKHEYFTDGEARWVPGSPLDPAVGGVPGDA